MRGEKILVAMSGGVDSSVAAHLLKEQGYEPVGVFMRSGVALPDGAAGAPRCCSAEDASDARRVAGQLGIPFYVLNFAEDFGRLIDRFCEEYGRGRTPNPCILCNRDLKFGRLFRYADALGAKCVATGHYARVEWPVGPSASPGGGSAEAGLAGRRGGEAGRWLLARGLDARKDQSYVLFPIPPERLERVRLPLGERTKQETRTIARELGLAVRDKPESQEICFVTGTIEDLVRQRRPDLVRPGPVLDLGGKELGRHAGIVNFTIGQRRGLGIALGEPMYVVAIRPQDAAIVVGPAEALRAKGLVAEEVVWHEPVPAEPVRAEVQIRYRHAAAGAWLERLEGDRAQVRFDEPQTAVTPGQAAVFYRGERVVGGGWIVNSK